MELTISIIYGSVRTERQGIKAAKFLDEFVWYAEAFKNQRDKGLPY